MTSREDRIQTAARAVHDSRTETRRMSDGYLSVFQGTDEEIATAVLDVVLPQITTVEQLDWLLASISHNATPAVVVDSHNRAWTVFEDDRGDWYAQRLGDQDEPRAVTIRLDLGEWPAAGPLTVVWQP